MYASAIKKGNGSRPWSPSIVTANPACMALLPHDSVDGRNPNHSRSPSGVWGPSQIMRTTSASRVVIVPASVSVPTKLYGSNTEGSSVGTNLPEGSPAAASTACRNASSFAAGTGLSNSFITSTGQISAGMNIDQLIAGSIDQVPS